MIDKKRKHCHLPFKAICGPKESNWGKYLILYSFVYCLSEKEVASTYAIENSFTKANLFREIIADT